MKRFITIIVLATPIVFFLSFGTADTKKLVNQPVNFQDSLQADRNKYINLILESIKGKENMRADSVFGNIKFLKMPAARLLRVMDIAYSRSLGVSCGHCHNTNDFSSEEKQQKEITRQMVDMLNKINGDLLKNIQGLKGSPAVVNCTTCHRGEIKPALNLPIK